MVLAKYAVKLLNEFESKAEDWGFSDFERRLTQLKPGGKGNYHDAKGVINQAHRKGQWPKTVKRYLCTNFRAHGNVSGDFNDTFSEVLSTMSDTEKQDFGILDKLNN